MHYFQRIEERTKATRKALKKCKTAQQQEKFGIWKAAVNVYGACTGCRNPDDANTTNTTKQRKQEVHKHENNCSYEPERRYR